MDPKLTLSPCEERSHMEFLLLLRKFFLDSNLNLPCFRYDGRMATRDRAMCWALEPVERKMARSKSSGCQSAKELLSASKT